jgi:hypothetical protein
MPNGIGRHAQDLPLHPAQRHDAQHNTHSSAHAPRFHRVLLSPGPSPAAAADADAVHISRGIRDQDHVDSKAPTSGANVSAVAGAGAGAGAAVSAGDGAAVAGAAPTGPQKLRSFRLSYEDVVQEEQLQEDLDDTIKSPSMSAAGLPDGSKHHTACSEAAHLRSLSSCSCSVG